VKLRQHEVNWLCYSFQTAEEKWIVRSFVCELCSVFELSLKKMDQLEGSVKLYVLLQLLISIISLCIKHGDCEYAVLGCFGYCHLQRYGTKHVTQKLHTVWDFSNTVTVSEIRFWNNWAYQFFQLMHDVCTLRIKPQNLCFLMRTSAWKSTLLRKFFQRLS
jgi:hypothetical protein